MSLDQRYVAHLREAARPADHYTCSLCQQRPPFLSRQEFLEHLESHSDELEVLCRDPNFDVETWGESQRSKVKRRNADPTSPPLRSSATQLMLPSVHWSGRKVRELWHPDSSSRRESSDTRCYPGMMDASDRGSHEDPPKRSSAHGGICMPIDPRWPDILLQPESRPISQEQLAAEVKSIYVGLTMVESKCIHVDKAEASATRDFQGESKISNEHWQALIALHRTLLHEHHDFFLAAQHPSASPALRRLASKYPMPARMWKHGIHSFLDLLRYRLPESVEYMISFIYTAYQMMSLLYETVPAFENAWIECLGDLGRYRKALEDVDVHDRENWADVARFWYDSASNKSPDPGRLYHHLDILARPIPPQQVPPPKWPPIRCSAFAHNRHPISTLLGKRLLNERDIELFHFCKFHHSMYQQRKQGEPLTDLGTQFWSRILSISGRQLYSMRCNFYQRTRHQAWIKSTPQIVPEMRNARGDFPYEDLSLELYASTPNERHCEGCARYTQHLCEQQQGNSVCKVGLQTETLTNDVKRHIRGSQKGSFQGIVGFIRLFLVPFLFSLLFQPITAAPSSSTSQISTPLPDVSALGGAVYRDQSTFDYAVSSLSGMATLMGYKAGRKAREPASWLMLLLGVMVYTPVRIDKSFPVEFSWTLIKPWGASYLVFLKSHYKHGGEGTLFLLLTSSLTVTSTGTMMALQNFTEGSLMNALPACASISAYVSQRIVASFSARPRISDEESSQLAESGQNQEDQAHRTAAMDDRDQANSFLNTSFFNNSVPDQDSFTL